MPTRYSSLSVIGIATLAQHRGLPSQRAFAGKGASIPASRDAGRHLDRLG
ncbi:MAG: hypothetical protein HY778_16705 [Betaproteobacteria bacterium]|nr:hypothetical protein [Betaproteobacteria bacterium]